MTEKIKRQPYGLWTSPITANKLSQTVRLEEVGWDSDGKTLVWLEGRSGKGILVAANDQGQGVDLNPDAPCRGGVGYGGGEFTVKDGVVFFAGFDGRLYRRSLGYGSPIPITPPFGAVASPKVSPDGRWVVYVYSDGEVDVLGIVDSMGEFWPQKLAAGADFYMQPVWSPDGTRLAWVEWDHPNMPWDGSRLVLAQLSNEGLPQIVSIQVIAGDDETVIYQPEFSPDGQFLSFIRSAGEWDSLAVYDLKRAEIKDLISPQGAHLMIPAWVQGMRSYAWSPDSRGITYIQNQSGFCRLYRYSIGSAENREIDIDPYTWLKQISISSQGELALIASSPESTTRIISGNGPDWTIAAKSSPEDIAPQYLPTPQPISWLSNDGVSVHGLYYAPSNPDFQADGKPPVIVHIHGGPTSMATAGFGGDTSYFTSRGYGWLEVNYRGSTGYGHTYMKLLRKRWGDLDVEDAVGGARALVSQGLANDKQLIIMGGSAGGYTVLNSLIRYPGVFKAGVCLYGVSNLFTLDQDTHKFEAFYNASLIGSLPEAAERYHTWSPVFHANKIQDALAIFQGEDDKVVPPSQSEEIVNILNQRGVPHIYKLYPGEGHGFRKSETIKDFYERTERFLQQNVLFAP